MISCAIECLAQDFTISTVVGLISYTFTRVRARITKQIGPMQSGALQTVQLSFYLSTDYVGYI